MKVGTLSQMVADDAEVVMFQGHRKSSFLFSIFGFVL
jgi:hypothetical protein